VEIATNISTKPSFTPPQILSTQIATTGTFGIIPFPTDLAGAIGITTLPAVMITSVPHHRDIPLHSLTRLVTAPTNQYRYIHELSIPYYQFTPMQSTTNSSQSLMTSSIVFLVLQRSLTHHMKHGRMSIMTSSHGLGTRMWKSRITSLRIKHWIPLLVVPTGGTVPQ